MRSIEYARARGREARQIVDAEPGATLLDRLVGHLETTYGLSLVPMYGAQMKGSQAQLNAVAKTIVYDASLGDRERLMRFAHELGHLVLHKRLRDGEGYADRITASAYGAAGPSAIARYSPRTYEETQAEAFALELVAPSDLVWQKWNARADTGIDQLATHFGCTVDVITTQLAHALHGVALGAGVPSASRKDVPFTAAQLTAAHFTGAPAIVDAGPGTGKTATVIERIRHLCEDRGARPSEILALTFSNEAAQELSERISVTLGEDVADAINVRTFHGFGMEFLHQHGHLAGYRASFTLLDEDAQVEMVNVLLGRVPCDRIFSLRAPLETAMRVVEHINYCKQRLYDVEAVERAAGAPGAAVESVQFAALYRAYENEKARTQRIDFADLIALPIRVLDEHVPVRAECAVRFPWVIVDEFQDVTRATSRLLHTLCGLTNPPWVVGDARQSIYQFLGAAPENVTAFTSDFKNAKVFALDVNYRSSAAIVTAANQLAALMEEDSCGGAGSSSERWRAGTATSTTSLDENPVAIAVAESDAAEAHGVVARVSEWIARDGVSPGDIAVLARRHVDVRNVMLELSRRGIKAQASGVLTAEGAAGTLAGVLTLAEAPVASIPRLVFALGGGRCSVAELNATVGALLKEKRHPEHGTRHPERSEGPLCAEEHAQVGNGEVADEVRRLYESARGRRDVADGFTALAAFLFNDGAYLRRILAMPDSAERAIAIVEIVSVLSLAIAYRVTHPTTPADVARIGFAERLRMRLTKTVPVPLAPRPRPDAVHVMTCHASKGLEFPCVVVVGQTLPGVEETLDWVPSSMRPNRSRERAQADALLFVGVTRAQRAVVVSYPLRATAGASGKGKAVVPLLERWRGAFGVASTEWVDEAPVETRVVVGNVWEVPAPRVVKASALDVSVCPVLTYLETWVGARFPEASRAMYPGFFAAVRKTLRAVATRAGVHGVRAAVGGVGDVGDVGVHAPGEVVLSDEDAVALLDEQWSRERWVGHPHAGVYREAAERMVVGFARALGRIMGGGGLGAVVDALDPEVVLSSDDGLDVGLDLVARFRREDGTVAVVVFRPEALRGDEGSLKWSELAESNRSSIALLGSARAGMAAFVYSGRDGRIYEYRPSRSAKSLPTLTAALEGRRDAFGRGEFSADVTRYGCDRCRVRVSCPQWVGAAAQ
ncbi:MAG TPA: UvrD-helicase domain-containing protein [Gemmatimonadaceae bacterium]